LVVQRQDSNLGPQSSMQSHFVFLFHDALIQSLIKKECKRLVEIKLTEKEQEISRKRKAAWEVFESQEVLLAQRVIWVQLRW